MQPTAKTCSKATAKQYRQHISKELASKRQEKEDQCRAAIKEDRGATYLRYSFRAPWNARTLSGPLISIGILWKHHSTGTVASLPPVPLVPLDFPPSTAGTYRGHGSILKPQHARDPQGGVPQPHLVPPNALQQGSRQDTRNPSQGARQGNPNPVQKRKMNNLFLQPHWGWS
jgi:hypothetical protein